MNTQLKELYRQAADAVEPAGDVQDVLTRAGRRRAATQVAAPLATAAVVAGAVGVAAVQPWAESSENDVAQGDGAHAAAVPAAATVAGNTYVLDDANAKGLPEGPPVEISFERGTYSAFAGCNTFRGSYDIRDNVLSASHTEGTAAACPQAEQADQWLESFLASGPQVDVSGDHLQLDNGASQMSLAVQRTDDAAFADTTWELDSVVDSSAAVSSVPRGLSPTLRYDDGSGEVAVDAGCGPAAVGADVGRASIDLSGYSTPSNGCSGSDAAFERSVRDVLNGSVSYEIDGAQLRISNGEGALVYTAKN